MDLALENKVLRLQISLKAWGKDSLNILVLFYNRNKIYEMIVVNAKVTKKENDDIMHWARHII